jgi:hypothetical protein
MTTTISHASSGAAGASRRRRDLEALILAIGTLIVLFVLAVASTSWPTAI